VVLIANHDSRQPLCKACHHDLNNDVVHLVQPAKMHAGHVRGKQNFDGLLSWTCLEDSVPASLLEFIPPIAVNCFNVTKCAHNCISCWYPTVVLWREKGYNISKA